MEISVVDGRAEIQRKPVLGDCEVTKTREEYQSADFSNMRDK